MTARTPRSGTIQRTRINSTQTFRRETQCAIHFSLVRDEQMTNQQRSQVFMIDNPMDEAQAGHKQLLDNKAHATAELLEIDKRRARPQSKSQGSAVIQTDRVVERLGNNTVEQPFRHCLLANGKLFRALRAPFV